MHPLLVLLSIFLFITTVASSNFTMSILRAFGIPSAAEANTRINVSLDAVRAKFYKEVGRELNENIKSGVRCVRVDVPDTLCKDDCNVFARDGYEVEFTPGYHIGSDHDWIPAYLEICIPRAAASASS